MEDFAWNFGNLFLIQLLNNINELAAGIYSIIFGVEILAVVLVGAIGNSTMTLTSEAVGKKMWHSIRVSVSAPMDCVLLYRHSW